MEWPTVCRILRVLSAPNSYDWWYAHPLLRSADVTGQKTASALRGGTLFAACPANHGLCIGNPDRISAAPWSATRSRAHPANTSHNSFAFTTTITAATAHARAATGREIACTPILSRADTNGTSGMTANGSCI